MIFQKHTFHSLLQNMIYNFLKESIELNNEQINDTVNKKNKRIIIKNKKIVIY